MSASQIQKLEALLERVHERRTATRPSTGSTAAKKAHATPLEAAMQDLGVVTPQNPQPQKPSSRPPKLTPAARPSVKPVSPPVRATPVQPPKPQPARPERPQPVAAKPVAAKPVAAKPVAAKPAQPVRLDAQPPASSGPVASVASKPEAAPPATFGALLDRTLALRPR